MTSEDETMNALKESGHRLTPQRMMVVAAVQQAGGHITASAVLERIKGTYPYIDASTVYRTLNVLKEMRLVSETDMGGGEYRYEWISEERHHHLVCRRCGGTTLLNNVRMETLGAEIFDEHGFEADIDHFAIFGVCRECLEDSQAG